MAASEAETPDAWLARLPPDRAEMLAGVRDLVNAALPPGYAERPAGNMLAWEVPLARYPDTYNRQPLMLAALAAQNNHNALYLVCAYTHPARDAALRGAYARAGQDRHGQELPALPQARGCSGRRGDADHRGDHRRDADRGQRGVTPLTVRPG